MQNLKPYLKQLRKQTGVSLIELLLMVVIIAAIVALIANLPNAMGLMTKTSHLNLAKAVAARQIEEKRDTNYLNLANGTSSVSDSRLDSLPASSGFITVEDCDPKICTGGETVKKITVTINWKDNNKTQNVTLTTFVGAGGLDQ